MTGSFTFLGHALRWGRRWLACLTVLGMLAPVAAGATRLSDPDARAVRQVVEAQLAAFAADDAKRAFSYASPSLRTQFGDASNFLAMVQDSYPMLVRPSGVQFFVAQAEGAADQAGLPVRQSVQLRDREGRLWKAVYLLERQPGTGWRISGCLVLADSEKTLT